MADYRAYWDRNIDKWGEKYLEISHGHETLDAPRWLSWAYNRTLGRVEANLMRQRYELTAAFIERYVHRGTMFCDIGCGTGLFTVLALNRGARVIAVDFSDSALHITAENVLKHARGLAKYVRADVQKEPIPECEVALAMGVTPYVQDLAAFLGNILPRTRVLCCQYTDPARISNRVRTALPFLNVRNLVFHSATDVDALYAHHGFTLTERKPFATGFIDVVSRARIKGDH